MTSNVLRETLSADPLARMADPSGFVGWVYGIDYETALVMTNDLWKDRAGGVPQNAFLTAAPFLMGTYSATAEADREVLLLRVVGTARLPSTDDLVATRIDHFQRQAGLAVEALDVLTQNQLQHHALECHILGTFFINSRAELRFGSDIESFSAAGTLNVFRPSGDALAGIVNYLDPDVRRRAQGDLAALASTAGSPLDPNTIEALRFRMGTVRYTSTDRIHRGSGRDLVPVYLQAADFLSRRTAIFGMTRSGKSNTVKHLVSAVKRVADEVQVPIGQLLFDLRGEYASANVQDRDAAGRAASLADAFPSEVIRYRARATEGFQLILNNFYKQLPDGLAVIHEVIRDDANSNAMDVQSFLGMSLDEPDQNDHGLHSRWQVKVAAYSALLFRAGFEPPSGHRVRFRPNAAVTAAIDPWHQQLHGVPAPDPSRGMTPEEAQAWFEAARRADRETHPSLGAGQRGPGLLRSTSGGQWLDTETAAMLNMLVQRNANDTLIRGHRVLEAAREYHSARRDQPVEPEIYGHLRAGKIVIVDLSVGPAFIRQRVSDRIARYIFAMGQEAFLAGGTPPSVVVYIEEAHNLISRDSELTDTWPTIAKEGAKFRIALVYATQEPSSIHPNILSNTENWIVTHLNNDDELRQLAKFYDFSDFTKSLKRATDVGFARVRTLSGKFVVPVQIDKFEPPAAGSV